MLLQVVQGRRQGLALVRVQVGVNAQRGRDLLVAQAVCNQQGVAPLLHQHRGVGMSQVVDPDQFHAGTFTAALQLSGQPIFCKWEKAVIRLIFIKPAGLFPDYVQQERRSRDNTKPQIKVDTQRNTG